MSSEMIIPNSSAMFGVARLSSVGGNGFLLCGRRVWMLGRTFKILSRAEDLGALTKPWFQPMGRFPCQGYKLKVEISG